jgi:hypothetical protein
MTVLSKSVCPKVNKDVRKPSELSFAFRGILNIRSDFFKGVVLIMKNKWIVLVELQDTLDIGRDKGMREFRTGISILPDMVLPRSSKD